MSATYKWNDPDHNYLSIHNENGSVTTVPASSDYALFREYEESGETADEYVAVVDARTDAERLEDATGLTVDEIKAVLGL
jgi:hypothetical protein